MAMNQAGTEELKNKIAEKEANKGAAVSTSTDPYRTVQAYLTKLAPEISKALPKHLSADRLTRIALTTIKMNPLLLQAPVESLLGAVLQAAQLGLEPNLMGSCYLIPYRDNKNNQMVVNFQIGFRGLIDLASRSGDLITIKPNVVRANDDFEFEYGTNERIRHIPARTNRGDIVAFYAYANMKNGGVPFEVMSVEDVNAIRDGFSKGGNIWTKHYEAMGKKTVIKQLLKYLPISVELQESLNMDERSYSGVDKSDFIDVENLVDITPEVSRVE